MKLSELFSKAFHPLWQALLDPNILHVVEKGGRGSGKSSDIAHGIVQLIMRYPVNAVAIRRIGDNLELSVYEQIKWAIDQQEVNQYFKITKNPLRVTYVPRGNYIAFLGTQNPARIKSLKDSKHPFAIAWIEELAEFKQEDDVTTITNSLLRGELGEGLFYKFIYSYNPPKRKQSWVNAKYETTLQPKNTVVHHTTYLDNPYISQAFIDEAETTRERNERRYEWEYLGKAIGSGVVPFDNLHVEAGCITDDMVANFDNIRNGNDFGYATDPNAFVRWHYDKKKNGIYAIDEIYEVKLSNRKLAERLQAKGYQSDEIFADSAEPKSIAELKDEHGILRIKGVKKGPDSVEFGERWLDDLDFICIDPLRTPHIAQEFENIDYQTDKDGNPKPRLEDANNHCVTGDTLVDTVDGQKPIKELVGSNGNVYAFNFDTNNQDILPYTDVRKTRSNTDVFKVTLEDGTEIKSTEDHLFLTDNGWKKLEEITENDCIINVFN